MKTNDIIGMALVYAAIAASAFDDSLQPFHREKKKPTKEDKERAERQLEKKRLELKKQQGVQEFWYGDKVIYARNQKNADRKAKNKGYL